MPSLILKQAVASANGTSPRSVTITAPASGNSLIVWAYTDGTGITTVSIADNQSNSYQNDLIVTSTSGTVNFWSATNITNAPTQLTATFDGGAAAVVYFIVFEVSGIDSTAGRVSWTGTRSGPTFTTSLTQSLTTLTNNELVVAWFEYNNTQVPTLVKFTELQTAASGYADLMNVFCLPDAGTAANDTYGGTVTTTNASMQALAYKAGSGGGGSSSVSICAVF